MQPRVVAHLEDGAVGFVVLAQLGEHLVGTADHRPQFPHPEAAAAQADPLLTVDRVAARDQDDPEHRRADHRRGDDQDREREPAGPAGRRRERYPDRELREIGAQAPALLHDAHRGTRLRIVSIRSPT